MKCSRSRTPSKQKIFIVCFFLCLFRMSLTVKLQKVDVDDGLEDEFFIEPETTFIDFDDLMEF